MQWRTALRKLRMMSPGEIGVRTADWAFVRYERRRVLALPANARLVPNAPQVRFPRGISGGRFFPSMRDPETLRTVLDRSFADETTALLARANEACHHRVTLFSHPYDLGATIDWQADPRTGWPWPKVFHADVFRPPSPAGVDVKHVWELNRHQVLVELGTAWLVSKRPEYVHAIREVVRGWIAQNPVGIGVNWAGPLEVAYRSLSWLWTAHLVDGALEEQDELRVEWARSLQDHAAFLYRHLELYSSPYNHLISEAAVLFILGLVFPDWPEAAKWRGAGRKVLEERLSLQFYQDGGSVEQAVGYHHATLGFYVLAALVARHNHEDLSAAVWQAIERAIEWSMWMMQPDGSHPAIGDNDDARPIRFSGLDTWDFRHFQALGAVLFERSDFKALAGRWHQDGEWLLDTGARARFDALEARHPSPCSTSLPASGYVVLRSGWDATADYVCFDVGEMAGGLRTDTLASAAHGHADCLAVVVWLGGNAVFVDAGFYSYNGDPRWERLFRATEMHNTVRVDGRSQAQYFGKMTWAEVPRVTLEGAQLDAQAGVLWARGAHDGYARGENGVTHTRTVVLKPGEYLAIVDDVEGRGIHTFDLNYLCAAGLAVRRVPAGVQLDDFTMVVVGAGSIDVLTARETDSANPACIAPGLDVITSTHRVAVEGDLSEPRVTILTLVAVSAGTPAHLVDDAVDEWPEAIRSTADALRRHIRRSVPGLLTEPGAAS
jgi:hypothetical protein